MSAQAIQQLLAAAQVAEKKENGTTLKEALLAAAQVAEKCPVIFAHQGVELAAAQVAEKAGYAPTDGGCRPPCSHLAVTDSPPKPPAPPSIAPTPACLPPEFPAQHFPAVPTTGLTWPG